MCRAMSELAMERLDAAGAVFTREIDLRYAGQGYELRTSLEGLYQRTLTTASLTKQRGRFDERHAQVHGHAAKERPVEVVSYRLRVRVAVPKYQPRQEAAAAAPANAQIALKGRRQVHFGGTSATDTAIYERDRLDI